MLRWAGGNIVVNQKFADAVCSGRFKDPIIREDYHFARPAMIRSACPLRDLALAHSVARRPGNIPPGERLLRRSAGKHYQVPHGSLHQPSSRGSASRHASTGNAQCRGDAGTAHADRPYPIALEWLSIGWRTPPAPKNVGRGFGRTGFAGECLIGRRSGSPRPLPGNRRGRAGGGTSAGAPSSIVDASALQLAAQAARRSAVKLNEA